jgi:phosphatidylserine decarboxylase
MTIHREGYTTIIIALLTVAIMFYLGYHLLGSYPFIKVSVFILALLFLIIVLQFFRHPTRKVSLNEKYVLAPADGKIVVIEETEETEVLKDKRIQVSIFMSPLNVHVNRYPVSGKISYYQYHPGLYLVAWHPKSSLENERTTVVIETGNKISIVVRQIAGALARRIICYSKKDEAVKQGDEMGFIKFGSRVDVFLPLDAKVLVSFKQKVTGGVTVLAELP